MKKWTCLIIGGIFANLAVGNELTLVDNGKPNASIILAEKPTNAAQFGAYELQHHIKLITGADLPIKNDGAADGINIYVGDSDAVKKLGVDCSQFGKQEYLIKFFPKAIVLAGKDKIDLGKPVYDYLQNNNAVSTWPSVYDEIGTMNAVYDFLEKYCGVKWINPTDAGMILSEKKTLLVSGSEQRRHPFMLYRGGSAGTDSSEKYQLNGGFWRDKTGEGERYNNEAYGKAFGKFSDQNQKNMAKRAQNRLFMYRMKGGGEKSQCNHSFYNFYDRFWDVKSVNYEVQRPEYFAKGYQDQPPQLCYSNDATVQQVVKDVRDYFDNGGYRKRMSNIPAPGYHWGENFYALEPMDNSAFCKCEKCVSQFEPNRRDDKSESSTYWFRFVNRVAKEIKKSHPDKKISTLAYMTHEGLPTGFKMEDNVVVHFCISYNRTPYNTAGLKKQLDRLREWDKKGEVPMYLWLYNTFPLEIADNGNFFCFPGFFAHEAKRQFDLFEKLKIKGIFHAGYNGEVDNYVTYKLMDDPKLDVDKLLEDYFSAYGLAGKPLRKMYELIEERYCNPKYYPKTSNGEPYADHQTVGIAWDYLGNEETMKQLQEHMDHAYTSAKTDQEKQLVKLWDDSVWSYMKTGRKTFIERKSYPIPEINAPKVGNVNGDMGKVDWNKAVSIGEQWYKRGGKEPAKYRMGGRVCHDDDYLYLELIDHVDPKRLVTSPQIACFDDWEIFIAGQRAQPFRQYMIGPTAMTEGISHGEVNWRQGVKSAEYTKKSFGMQAYSDTSGDKWVLQLCFPLKEMLEKPVKSGDDIYVNMVRVRNPQLAGERLGVDTWVAYTTVSDVDRLAKIHLE
ncbi:MAG: DUF4838 domain-containing protein [Victivallales bacterium]